jgi:hypothetical protein
MRASIANLLCDCCGHPVGDHYVTPPMTCSCEQCSCEGLPLKTCRTFGILLAIKANNLARAQSECAAENNQGKQAI